MTERGTNRINLGTPTALRTTCSTPARMPAASRYSTPWSLTKPTTTRAIAPVAAEIIAGRPPAIAIVTAIVNEANSPTLGSTPAMIENEIASGIRASATTRPARSSTRSTARLGSLGREGTSVKMMSLGSAALRPLDRAPPYKHARVASAGAERVDQDRTNASRSALIVSASVVGMPCGNPL
jgi:hypothetical protein